MSTALFLIGFFFFLISLDVLEFYQTESKDPAAKMLVNWFKEDDADLETLLYFVEGLKMATAVDCLKKMIGKDDDES